jgi:hypothetical protein
VYWYDAVMLKQLRLAGWWSVRSLGVCAFTLILIDGAKAYEFTEPQIDAAIALLKPQWGNNPAFFGYVGEELVRQRMSTESGRFCVLSKPNDRSQDIACSGKARGRPIYAEVKSGDSPTEIAKVCDALRTGRYSGRQLWLATETYRGVVARCGELAASRGGMVRDAEITKARIVGRIAALNWMTTRGVETSGVLRLGKRALRWIPFVGTAVGAGVTIAETYAAVTDPAIADSERVDRGIATASEEVFTWGASTGACALTIAMLPSAPIALPVVAGVAVGISVGYTISRTGIGATVGNTAVFTTWWTVDQAHEAWHWMTSGPSPR